MSKRENISLTVDAVVFGYDAKEGLSVLLIKRKINPFKGSWAIPGGFLLENETLEEGVQRELKEETGVEVDFLEQLYTFGTPNRDPRSRIITVAYFGLVQQSNFELHASTDAEDAQWFNVNELPSLAFDHKNIFNEALKRLRGKITYEPIGFNLLDKKFPFSDLHKLYETILGLEGKIDRRNFRKKFLQLDILNELEEKTGNGRGRPGSLYQFDEKKYFALKKQGMVFEI